MIEVRLSQLLEEKGKSLYWLEKQSGIRYNTLHPFAKGKRESVFFDNLDKICEVLECQPGDLLVHVPNKSRGR